MPPTRAWMCHTFTAIARCPRENLLGIALVSSPIAAAARCPFIRTGVGAVSSQAYTDPALGPLALNLLEIGYSPEKALQEVVASDDHASYRQIGIINPAGRTAVYTGEDNLDWKGHVCGDGFIAMGNYLHGAEVVEAMAESLRHSEGSILEERLMKAIEAGKDGGGERGGQLSGGLLVHGQDCFARTDLRVDLYEASDGTDAVDELRRLANAWIPLIPYYEERPRRPTIEPWRQWLSGK